MSHPIDRRDRFIKGVWNGKRRAKGICRGSLPGNTEQEKAKFVQKSEYLRRNTTQLCSCDMCGNPRKVDWKDKLTMQEKKFLESLDNMGL